MVFEEIIPGKLWAVKYDGDEDNILNIVMERMMDTSCVRSICEKNEEGLRYHGVDIETAIDDTQEDAINIFNKLLSVEENSDLDKLFWNLSKYVNDPILQRSKGFLEKRKRHKSWIRIYAVKLESGKYIITGGTIKLVKDMRDAENTQIELDHLNQCREYLKSNGAGDYDSFIFGEFTITNQQ